MRTFGVHLLNTLGVACTGSLCSINPLWVTSPCSSHHSCRLLLHQVSRYGFNGIMVPIIYRCMPACFAEVRCQAVRQLLHVLYVRQAVRLYFWHSRPCRLVILFTSGDIVVSIDCLSAQTMHVALQMLMFGCLPAWHRPADLHAVDARPVLNTDHHLLS